MPRRPATFTQADIARVLRAVAETGVPMRIEIADGKISVEPVAAQQGPAQYKGEIKL